MVRQRSRSRPPTVADVARLRPGRAALTGVRFSRRGTSAVRRPRRAAGARCHPEGAAALAAVARLRAGGWLTGDEQVVVLNTGAGVKYPETVP